MHAVRLVIFLYAAILAAGAASAETHADRVVELHPDLGEVIDAGEAAALGLFPDLGGIGQIVFVRTAAGGVVARIVLDGPNGTVLRERSIPSDVWASWRADAAAGRPLAAALPVPPPGLVWPERDLRPDEVAPDDAPPPIPAGDGVLTGEWIMMLDAGYKRSTTRFRDYFTDMVVADMAVGYGLHDRVWPFLAFQIGSGDLQDAFEDITADGRSAVYAFELGTRFNAPLTHRLDAVASVAGGYYMRSMRWGGDLFVSPYGYVQSGTTVREFSDWGGSARLGVQWALGGRDGRARYLDLTFRAETYSADPYVLIDPENDAALLADDRDTWWSVTMGLAFGL